MIYTTKELEDYELMIGAIADAVLPRTLEGFHSLYVRVYQHGKRWVDVDNVLKAILDGLDNSKIIKRGKKDIQVCSTGIENDKFFQLVVSERYLVNSKENERLEIVIVPYNGLDALNKVVQEAFDTKAEKDDE